MKTLIAASQTLTILTVIICSACMMLNMIMLHQDAVKGLIGLAKTFPQ